MSALVEHGYGYEDREDVDVAELAAERAAANGRVEAAPSGDEEPNVRRPAEAVPLEPGRMVDGATFVFAEPAELPAIWGSSDAPLWAEGEGLMLVGPDGVGKTTIAQQLLLARIGLRGNCLGLTAKPAERRVLYIAADRPRQAARSLARMVTAAEKSELADRLLVWRGPLPFDLTASPRQLAEFANGLDIGTVFIDSLKDVALDLSKDEVGSRVNLALQELIARGIDTCVLHHQRKEGSDGKKPKRLADVYGSRWLTAGMGSVALIWGEPGDPVVDLTHLKQPADEVGPLRIVHEHTHGRSTVQEGPDLEQILAAANAGLTVADAARQLFELDLGKPTPSQTEKARRRLEKLVEHGRATRDPDPDGTARYHHREERP